MINGNGSLAYFLTLQLHTHQPQTLMRFYDEVIGLPVAAEDGGAFSIQAGGTRLIFQPSPPESQPFYHFAFNIPENKINRAAEWLVERAAPLPIPETGEVVAHFVAWNAHAVYFEDPAGNIVEFIARHSLDNSSLGGFDVGDILYASEIGLVVADIPRAAEAIMNQLGIEPYGEGGDSFMPIGDPHGLFILVKEGRVWFPTKDKKAQAFPLQIEVSALAKQKFNLPNTEYEIRVEGTEDKGLGA